jgi:hypothetical protein
MPDFNGGGEFLRDDQLNFAAGRCRLRKVVTHEAARLHFV